MWEWPCDEIFVTSAFTLMAANAMYSWWNGRHRGVPSWNFHIFFFTFSHHTIHSLSFLIFYFTQLAERFLSSESLEAVKSVQDILRSVEDHGVEVDVFRRHRKRDLIASIYALAKLQSACQHLRQSRQEEIGDTVSNDLLKELAYFAKFSTAAYGWTLELATRGAAHRGDSTRALCTRTGVSEDDIVLEEWDSQPNRPATYIVRDHKSKSIVVGVRGTWSGHDVLVDLSCTSEEYQVALQKYRAHKGMLDAARGVDQLAKDIVEKEFENYPDYKLIICGHSMGGSVAAILGTLWRKSFQQSIKVYAYGPACTFPLENKDDEKDNALSIVSVLNEGDPFSCLSLGHVADLSYCLDRLCDDGDLRSTILWRTDGKTPEMEERDLQWCEESLLKLKQRPSNDQSTAKNTLYPPGKLILLRTDRHDDKIHDRWMEPRKIPFKNRARKGCYAQPVPKSAFQDLVIGPRMVDLTRHVPKLYESRLHECLDNALATGTS